MTYPSVAEAVAADSLHLHGWIYEIETTGNVLRYDPTRDAFVSLT